MPTNIVSLYLVRHAVAEERGPKWPNDDLRPLTERGARRFAAAAAGLVALDGPPDEIFTSPLVRARQTADLLVKAARGKVPVHVIDTLAPEQEPDDAIAAIKRRWKGDRIAVVGHEPDLGELAAHLLDSESPFTFKKGGACRIDLARGRTHRAARLVWFLPPNILRQLR
jgi:phosphohistidine phosphatase